MKVIGQLLLWLGFLSGALATVFRSQSSGMQYVKNLKAEGFPKQEKKVSNPSSACL